MVGERGDALSARRGDLKQPHILQGSDAVLAARQYLDDIAALESYLGAPIEKHTEGRSATLKGRVGDGPNIKLTANRGWISVRKEGTQPSEVLPDTPGEKVRVRLRRRRHPSLPKTCVIAKSRCDVVG